VSASKVRMGQAFVEIGATTHKLFKALNAANARIGRFASGMRSVGTKMMSVGTAMAAPIAAAAVVGARFQDVMLNMRASTGATAQQMDQMRSAAMSMSAALGVGPTEAASGFLELLKAGMSVEQVLGGAGQAALQFAKVGQMSVSEAAVVMADAMTVFSVGGEQAANTLSAAADASSTNVHDIALAFSQVSAVAGLANQSIGDTAAALAVLANNGVKGSDAGTSLKTMLMRLMAPADDAAEALAGIGLSGDSFRGADGRMRSMVEIIGTLNTAMAGMGQAGRDDIFRRIFGQDAIRAAAILTTAGVDGFGAMTDSMQTALPVSAKFGTIMSGLSGSAASVLAAMQRLGIAVSDAVAPALAQMGEQIVAVVNGLATFASKNGELVASIAKGVAIFAGAGVATYALGAALGAVSAVAGVVLPFFGAIVTTTVSMAAGFVGLIAKVVAFKVASIAAAAVSAAAWAAANLPFIALGAAAAVVGTAMFAVADGVGTVRSVVGGLIGTLVEAGKAFVTMKDVGVMAFGEIV
jgi:TP901 family phage tail tape measure protein